MHKKSVINMCNHPNFWAAEYITAPSDPFYEPRHEKTCLWGFQPGPTQTEQYSHKRWLEAGNLDLGSRGIILSM